MGGPWANIEDGSSLKNNYSLEQRTGLRHNTTFILVGAPTGGGGPGAMAPLDPLNPGLRRPAIAPFRVRQWSSGGKMASDQKVNSVDRPLRW